MNLFIITGGSKGLGRAFAEKALSEGHFCVTLSRTVDKNWKSEKLIQVRCDLLQKFKMTKKILDRLYSKLTRINFENVFLINNAAQIEPVAELGMLDETKIDQHIQLNLNVPILLSNDFLKRKFKVSGYRILSHVSSGASQFAITNWSLYCATKAGLEMFNSVVQIQTQKSKKLKSMTFSPGIIDTGMQKKIRSFSKANFPEVQRFKQYKKESQLRSPDDVAEMLYQILIQPRKMNKASYSI